MWKGLYFEPPLPGNVKGQPVNQHPILATTGASDITRGCWIATAPGERSRPTLQPFAAHPGIVETTVPSAIRRYGACRYRPLPSPHGNLHQREHDKDESCTHHAKAYTHSHRVRHVLTHSWLSSIPNPLPPIFLVHQAPPSFHGGGACNRQPTAG